MDLYDVARDVTDEVLGEGTYADTNEGNPNPGVQGAIKRDRMKTMRGRDEVRREIEAEKARSEDG